MYTLASATAPAIPAYSGAAVTTGSIIFLALLTCAITAAILARHRRSARPMVARKLRSRHAAEELKRETVEAWFDAPNLAGFPTQKLDEMLPGIGRAEWPRLQTAWLLVAHGHDAVWLTGHFGLSSDVARLLEDSAQRSNTSPRP